MSSAPALDPAALIQALKRRNLPAPIAVDPVGDARLHAVYRLRFQGARVPSLLLRRVVHCPGWDTLATEQSALDIIGDTLPIATEFDRLNPRELGFPAAFVSDLPGKSGADWIQESPHLGPEVAAQVAAVRVQLDSHAFARPAMCGTGNLGFLPQRSSWRQEWHAFHGMWTAALHQQGATLGPLSDALEAAFDDLLPSLDTAKTWTLVHRDLHPGNVLLTQSAEGLVLSGVIDWSGAMVGDPLVEWLQPLQMPEDWLQAYIQAIGPEAVQAALQPDALARLQVYNLTRCLARLALAGMPPYFGHHGRLRAHGLELAQGFAKQALDPDFISRKLKGTQGHRVQVRVHRVGLRRALERLRFIPLPVDTDAPLLTAALSLFDDATDPAKTAHARRLADHLLDRCAPPITSATWEPIHDVRAWRSALLSRCLEHATGDRSAALWLWLGLQAIDQLDGTVSNAIRRGLEAAFELRLIHEQRSAKQSRSRDALVGALAWLCLAESQEYPTESREFQRANQAVVDAWDLIEPFPVPNDATLPTVEQWPPQDWSPGSPEDAQLCALLRALRQVRSWPLPVGRGHVWRHRVEASQARRA